MTDDLYHEEILEHYKHPNNFGTLNNPDITVSETNASCGDSFTFQLKIIDGKIADIAFQGQGCAISTAAASMLTEHIKGKPLTEISAVDIPFMQDLIGVEVSTARLKCLTLARRALSQIAK